MSKDLIIAILALAFTGCCGALLVTLAKLDEQKQKTAEEHTAYRNALEYGNALAEALREEQERRWDEISRAVGFENELEQSKAREKCSAQAVLWYAEQLANVKQEAEGLRMGVDYLGHREDVLQDRLSALLCPHNDHVWKDGVCVKCGRVKDATD